MQESHEGLHIAVSRRCVVFEIGASGFRPVGWGNAMCRLRPNSWMYQEIFTAQNPKPLNRVLEAKFEGLP